jgi:hypothetical protein
MISQLRHLAFATASLLFMACPAFASNLYTPGGFTMLSGSSISVNSIETLNFETDGNLILSQTSGVSPSGSIIVWASGTGGRSCANKQCTLIFQADGNLVMYDNGGAYWASNTSANELSALSLGPAQELLITPAAPYLQIRNANFDIVWTATPQFALGNLTLLNGTFVLFRQPGEPNYALVMQDDGNFVLYSGALTASSKAVWASNTSGDGGGCGVSPAGCRATFQSDGNLVLYGSTAYWASNTATNELAARSLPPATELSFQPAAPYLKILGQGQAVWSSAAGN